MTNSLTIENRDVVPTGRNIENPWLFSLTALALAVFWVSSNFVVAYYMPITWLSDWYLIWICNVIWLVVVMFIELNCSDRLTGNFGIQFKRFPDHIRMITKIGLWILGVLVLVSLLVAKVLPPDCSVDGAGIFFAVFAGVCATVVRATTFVYHVKHSENTTATVRNF